MKNILKDYAAFVRINRIKEFVTSEIATIISYNVPLMEFLRHVPEEQLKQTSEASLVRFLEGIENETILSDTDKNLDNYKNNGMPGIPRTAATIIDLLLIYSAQKISFQQFIKDYTTDVTKAVEVMQAIEVLYKQIQEKAVKVLETIKEEEQSLRIESEENFKDLFDNAGDLVQIVAQDGTIILVNKKWQEVMGYCMDELKEESIYNFIKKSEKESFIQQRDRIINQTSVTNELKTSLVTKTGKVIMVEGYATVKKKDGNTVYTTGILRDVTERIQQENQLRYINEQLIEREEYARQLIYNAPDAVIVIDANNIIRLWNPKAEAIFGWTVEEATGMSLSDTIIPLATREGHRMGMKRLLETGKPRILNKTIDLIAQHKSGRQFPISLTVSQSKHLGEIVFISFLRDNTTQKQNELEIENKRKQLEKTNEELEQFAWLTSHDLKEPLRKILTFSDALIKKHEGNVPESTFQYIQKIHSSAFRMNNLIEAILMYSNVDDTAELFVECDLNTVLADVIDDLELMIENKRATIKTTNLPVINAIPIQMQQLFQNLVTNALKYSKVDVPPAITITCDRMANDYSIVVTDNGIGFEKAYTEKIFHVFQRLLNNKAYEGTGIGLALCKKIMENHKGSIHAESEPGEGSKFFIMLPATQ